MPLTTLTGGVSKSARRFRYSVTGSPTTWTDATYRYYKWTGSGSLNVSELPMDGNVAVEYQVVGAGGPGNGGMTGYWYSSYACPGSGGGGGQIKTGTASLDAIGSMSVSAGAGSTSYATSVSMQSYARYSPGIFTTYNPGSSPQPSSLGSLGSFAGVSAAAGSRGTYGFVDWRSSPISGSLSDYYGGDAGDGTAGSVVSWVTANKYANTGAAGASSSNAGTLWDGSSAGFGGTGGTSTVSGSTTSGYGNGGGGAGLDSYGSSYSDTEITGTPSTLATAGVVIARWALTQEAHG